MERVLFDTNVILDIALHRSPYFEDAVQLFLLIDKQSIAGHVTATTITDIYYISKREKGHKEALEFISDLMGVVDVVGVDKEVIIQALQSEMRDFEDAIQVSAASFNGIDYLITRNQKDFHKAGIPTFSPEAFLARKE